MLTHPLSFQPARHRPNGGDTVAKRVVDRAQLSDSDNRAAQADQIVPSDAAIRNGAKKEDGFRSQASSGGGAPAAIPHPAKSKPKRADPTDAPRQATAELRRSIIALRSENIAEYIRHIPLDEGKSRVAALNASLDLVAYEQHVRPELYLGRRDRLQINYSHISRRLANAAKATMYLLPGDQAEGILRIDQMCTTLLTPKRPARYDPALPLPIEGLGERAVRDHVAQSLIQFLGRVEKPTFAISANDLIGFGQRFSPQVRVPFYKAIAERIMIDVPSAEQFSYILELFVEANKLPLAAAANLKPILYSQITKTAVDKRCVNRELEREIMHRLNASEPLHRAVAMTKALEGAQKISDLAAMHSTSSSNYETYADSLSGAVSDFESLAANVETSVSTAAYQFDLQNLRKTILFAAQAPLVVRERVLNAAFTIAVRCDFKLGFHEFENALISTPKIDRTFLDLMEQREHRFIYRLQHNHAEAVAEAGDRHRYSAAGKEPASSSGSGSHTPVE